MNGKGPRLVHVGVDDDLPVAAVEPDNLDDLLRHVRKVQVLGDPLHGERVRALHLVLDQGPQPAVGDLRQVGRVDAAEERVREVERLRRPVKVDGRDGFDLRYQTVKVQTFFTFCAKKEFTVHAKAP